MIGRRADEHQSARSDNGATHVQATGVALAFRKFVGDAQGHLPSEFPGRCVNRSKTSPWRLLTWHEFVVESWKEAGAARAVLVVGSGSAIRFLFDPTDRTFLVGIDEDKAETGIDGGAAPI